MTWNDENFRETVRALLEGISIIWLMIFSSSMAGLETVLDLPPPPRAQIEFGVWSYAMAALIFAWLSWLLLMKLIWPAALILNRTELGRGRVRLFRMALIRAAQPAAVISFVLFVAVHLPHGTTQVWALLGVVLVARWFARNSPAVAERLVARVTPGAAPVVADRPAPVLSGRSRPQ